MIDSVSLRFLPALLELELYQTFDKTEALFCFLKMIFKIYTRIGRKQIIYNGAKMSQVSIHLTVTRQQNSADDEA